MQLFSRKKISLLLLTLLGGFMIFSVNAGNNLLPVKEFKKSPKTNFPEGWAHQYNKLATYEVIEDVTFKSEIPVLKVNNPPAAVKPISIRTDSFQLPAKGKLTASVWAKGTGVMTIFVIQADWKGPSKYKKIPIGSAWKEYSFDFELSETTSKRYFYRIDCTGKGQVFFASPALQMTLTEYKRKKLTHRDRYIGTGSANLVINSDFELGWTGWHPRYFNPANLTAALKQLKRALPEIKDDAGIDGGAALYMPAGNYVESLCMPLQRGKTYTVSALIKADKPVVASMQVIDYKWRNYGKKINIGTEWKRYFFTFTWDKPCYYDEVYLRYDAPADCGMMIDKIQFIAGAKSVYVPPSVTLGVLAKSNIYHRNEPTGITLKSVPVKNFKQNYSISLKVTDYQGKQIFNKIYQVAQGRPFQQVLDLPTAKYGLNIIDLKAFSYDKKVLGIGLGRYAVVRKLPDDFQKYYTMGVNFYPHYYPLAYYAREVPQWKKIGTGNALSGYTTKYSNSLDSPEFIKLFKDTFKYFKNNGYTTSMRICMPPAVITRAWFNKFPAGNELWQKYVTDIVKNYSDVNSLFTFMGEINIYRMRTAWRNYCKEKNPPPNGTELMPPEKGFKYYKSAYLAAKKPIRQYWFADLLLTVKIIHI